MALYAEASVSLPGNTYQINNGEKKRTDFMNEWIEWILLGAVHEVKNDKNINDV